MFKIVAGVVLGLVACVAVATLANRALRAGLSGYSEVEASMNFTPVMLWSRLLVGALSSLAAGATAAAVSRQKNTVAAKVVGAILTIMFIPVHYQLWTRFPIWYHAVFLVSLAPVTILGARLWPAPAKGKAR